MQLTVDCELTPALWAFAPQSALAGLLAKAKLAWRAMPLEAHVCSQFGLAAQPDYPIAPIAADADGLTVANNTVANDFWLRAAPAHLALQRDTMTLSNPVPLALTDAHSATLLASLNQHFGADGLRFVMGRSGAWYLHLARVPALQTTLPQAAIGQNVFNAMPKGAEGRQWGSILNELQMLLHEHPVNEERVQQGLPAINTLWLSGGGVMPLQPLQAAQHDLIIAQSAFYAGLAQRTGSAYQALAPLKQTLPKLQAQRPRIVLTGDAQADDDATFQLLRDLLRARRITQLTLQLGCYERTLIASIRPMQLYQFWRQPRAVASLLA